MMTGRKENTMFSITNTEYEAIPRDYRGIWEDYYGDHPEWKGRKTVMSTCITHNANELCYLMIEGVHFNITEKENKNI